MPKVVKPHTAIHSSPLGLKDSIMPKKVTEATKSTAKTVEKTLAEPADERAKPAQIASVVKPADPKPSPAVIKDYLFLVRLSQITDPTITRLLSVPSNFTFAKLHKVLQIAFGWANCHGYSFVVSKLLEQGERANYLTGRGEQILILGRDTELCDTDFTLASIYNGVQYKGKVEVEYKYDHADNWDHEIVFLGRTDPTLRRAMQIPQKLKVVCLGGQGHPCAEACGSSPGWENLKKTFNKRNDPEGRKEWYKNKCANGHPEGLDPYEWDIVNVNYELAKGFK